MRLVLVPVDFVIAGKFEGGMRAQDAEEGGLMHCKKKQLTSKSMAGASTDASLEQKRDAVWSCVGNAESPARRPTPRALKPSTPNPKP